MKKSFYIYSDGVLSRKDNTIHFENDKGDRTDIPIEQVSDLYIFGQMNLNVPFINLLSQNQITMHFFNYYDNYIGSFYPKEKLLAGSLLVKQVEFYLNQDKRMELARSFIVSASANIYRNLRYYSGRGKDVQKQMSEISDYREQLQECNSVQEIMGIEGNIRRSYYSAWNEIVNQNISFEKRVMHPPDNYINSLISFVNSLIYSKTLTQIYRTQLNPTISYLHEPGQRRFSLCLDLSEIFKPLLGDRLIFSLLNRNQITEDSFVKELNGLHLKKQASQLIMQELDQRLKTTINHKELGKSVSYEYLIRLEAYRLEKHLLNEKQYKGFEMWW